MSKIEAEHTSRRQVYPKRMKIAAQGASVYEVCPGEGQLLKRGMRTLPVATPQRLLKEDTACWPDR